MAYFALILAVIGLCLPKFGRLGVVLYSRRNPHSSLAEDSRQKRVIRTIRTVGWLTVAVALVILYLIDNGVIV